MKQLLQNMRNGQTIVEEIPVPQPRPKTALIRTGASLVSAGTERMLVEFAEKSLLGKVQSRPDLVKQMIDKARREGLINTIQAAFNRLDQPMALGYSSSGTIVALGPGLEGFKIGDRVACAGGNYAVHAEYEIVPQNLMVHLPDNVPFEDAAFATLGAIALQGFRLGSTQIGENVAVIGLGLLGLLSVEIACAAGCRVFGVDISPERIALAKKLGIEAVTRSDAESAASSFTAGKGFDSVLICADTKNDDPVHLAGTITRDHGSVIAVGAVGLNLPRKVYYEKELDFRVSRSYGPGRYDPSYEEKGMDYPYGYVRWTEGRNIQAFVELISSQKARPSLLVTHSFPIEQAASAYDLITGRTKEPYLGILITYPNSGLNFPVSNLKVTSLTNPTQLAKAGKSVRVGVLGAGNYASAVFLPTIKKVGEVIPEVIASASGLTAAQAAKKFGYTFASSSEADVLANPNVNAVVLLTRHNQHANQVITALSNGKAVYCEKPLAINSEQLTQIKNQLQMDGCPLLMVGFNRRFAPLSIYLADFLKTRSEPLIAHYRVNAGYLPLTHWTQDADQGGGRIIGEGCHFIDYLSFLVGTPPKSVIANKIPDSGRYYNDNVVITFTFPDGSLGTLTYLANGDKSLPKEYLEVFCGGKVALLKDYRSLELISNGHRKVHVLRFNQNKGHLNSWKAFLSSLQNGSTAPIPINHLLGVTAASFAAVEALNRFESICIED